MHAGSRDASGMTVVPFSGSSAGGRAAAKPYPPGARAAESGGKPFDRTALLVKYRAGVRNAFLQAPVAAQDEDLLGGSIRSSIVKARPAVLKRYDFGPARWKFGRESYRILREDEKSAGGYLDSLIYRAAGARHIDHGPSRQIDGSWRPVEKFDPFTAFDGPVHYLVYYDISWRGADDARHDVVGHVRIAFRHGPYLESRAPARYPCAQDDDRLLSPGIQRIDRSPAARGLTQFSLTLETVTDTIPVYRFRPLFSSKR